MRCGESPYLSAASLTDISGTSGILHPRTSGVSPYTGAVLVMSDIRRGEILKEMAEEGERAMPGDADGTGREPSAPTLADLHTNNTVSGRFYALWKARTGHCGAR